jgi:hypothetical protein
MTADDLKVALVELALEGIQDITVVNCGHAVTTDRIMMCNCHCGSICYVCPSCQPRFCRTGRWFDFNKEHYIPSNGTITPFRGNSP